MANIQSFKASVCGFLTSLLLVIGVIDWTTFNWKNPNDLIKLGIILLPWLGGVKSELKS